MTDQINMSVNDGAAMFAHEMSVNFSPTLFMLDFKSITPRNDPRSKDKPSFLLQHNLVMVEPWHVKSIIEVLQATVKKYEDEYGKIAKPKAILKAEKKQKLLSEQSDKGKDTPTYMG
jgi:hypothetical protein